MNNILGFLLARIYKKVSINSSSVFVLIAGTIATSVIFYARWNYESELKRKVAEFKVVAAEQTREMLVEALKQEHVTLEALFHDSYERISVEEFRATYVSDGDQPQRLRPIPPIPGN